MQLSTQTQHSALAYVGAPLPFIYMPAPAVSNAIGRSIPTLYKLISAGRFPQGDLIDTNTRRWRSDVVAKWLEETAEKAAAERETSDRHIKRRARLSVEGKLRKAELRAAKEVDHATA
jgi:predicted DNA-binding transcriptional regulator AlpA